MIINQEKGDVVLLFVLIFVVIVTGIAGGFYFFSKNKSLQRTTSTLPKVNSNLQTKSIMYQSNVYNPETKKTEARYFNYNLDRKETTEMGLAVYKDDGWSVGGGWLFKNPPGTNLLFRSTRQKLESAPIDNLSSFKTIIEVEKSDQISQMDNNPIFSEDNTKMVYKIAHSPHLGLTGEFTAEMYLSNIDGSEKKIVKEMTEKTDVGRPIGLNLKDNAMYLISSSGNDRNLQLHSLNIETGETRTLISALNSYPAIAYPSDFRKVYHLEDRKILEYDTTNNQTKTLYEIPQDVINLNFFNLLLSETRNRLYLSTNKNNVSTIYVINLTSGETQVLLEKEPHTDLSVVKISPDGKYILLIKQPDLRQQGPLTSSYYIYNIDTAQMDPVPTNDLDGARFSFVTWLSDY